MGVVNPYFRQRMQQIKDSDYCDCVFIVLVFILNYCFLFLFTYDYLNLHSLSPLAYEIIPQWTQ
jgi:hypothetical protein